MERIVEHAEVIVQAVNDLRSTLQKMDETLQSTKDDLNETKLLMAKLTFIVTRLDEHDFQEVKEWRRHVDDDIMGMKINGAKLAGGIIVASAIMPYVASAVMHRLFGV